MNRLLLGLLVFAVAGCLGGCGVDTSVDSASPEPEYLKEVGSVGVVDTELYAAVDKESWKELANAMRARDLEGIGLLLQDGKIYSINRGTKVRLLELYIFERATRFRVLDGEHYSKALITNSCFLVPEKTEEAGTDSSK